MENCILNKLCDGNTPKEVPSNPEHSVILWFCDSVILWLVRHSWVKPSQTLIYHH